MIVAFSGDIVESFGSTGQQAMLFPSEITARRCVEFMLSRDKTITSSLLQVVDLALDHSKSTSAILKRISPAISAVIFPAELFPVAKQFWQHSGEGVSSRRAEFCHGLFQEGLLVDLKTLRPITNGQPKPCRGPRRYQKGSMDKSSFSKASRIESDTSESQNGSAPNGASESRESTQFLEERFGRNLDVSFADNAKSAICRRIADALSGDAELTATPSPVSTTPNLRGVTGLSEDDVYLYPCGMNAIFHVHRMMLEVRGPMESISFGFPYVDTLKILQKFGPGCIFYGNGSADDLDNLEARLKAGEKYLALFCEFPGNPMLKCPDLQRIRQLADTYDFAVVIDETISNFINVHVLPFADVVVSSLTKVFSGECNVMGGSAIFNPQGRYYSQLKQISAIEFEDNYWAEDVMFMERNSRHFVARIESINENAEVICDVLRAHPLVKDLFYPKYNSDRSCYDVCRNPNGGYGGLLSFTFHSRAQAIAFFDRIETAKGPSLGTNFTLVSPYVILAHYYELDWAAQFGVPADLLRISVGLEDPEDLKSRFKVALNAAQAAS